VTTHDEPAALRGLLGRRPIRPIAKQSDLDRTALAAETGGAPKLDLSAESNVGSTPFIDYIYADVLHTLQQPRGSDPEEVTFITMAQVMELQFKLLAYELTRAQLALREDDLPAARVIFRRAHRILDYLGDIWSVLSTITPHGYQGFRDHLGLGSGFESFMYRRLEFVLGNKQPRMLVPHEGVPEVHAVLAEVLRAPSLYDDAIALLARRGLPIDPSALDRDWSEPYAPNDSVRAAWLEVYRTAEPPDELYQLGEALMDLADRFKVWRYRHFVTVERLIGFKPGTGGSGIGWLRKVIDQNVFPELWEVRNGL
jgi:tryptophan 2,3-dioxygenase